MSGMIANDTFNPVCSLYPEEPNTFAYPILLIAFFILLILVQVMYHEKTVMRRANEEMEEMIISMVLDHEKELEFEKNRGRIYLVKINMQHKENCTKVGALHRKLCAKTAALKAMTEKMATLEVLEEDMKELVEELSQSKQLLSMKEEIIVALSKQLAVVQKNQHEMNELFEKKMMLRVPKEEDKENIRTNLF